MSHQPYRKLFDKLVRTENVRRDMTAMNEGTAFRFVEALKHYDDPMDALFQLSRSRDKQLVRTMLSLGSSSLFIHDVILPFLRWLGQGALSRGTCRRSQQKILNDIARLPGLLETLLDELKTHSIPDERAVVWFVERLLLDDGESGAEARASSVYFELLQLMKKSTVPSVKKHAESLHGIVQNSDTWAERKSQRESSSGGGGGVPSLDDIGGALPGGRHSNDQADFRSIMILPSMDEILCPEPPFLPTPLDTAWPHLDRQFRLLRHDMVSSLTDAVGALDVLRKSMAKKSGGITKASAAKGRRVLVLSETTTGDVIANSQDRHASVLIHFDWPRNHALSNMKNTEQRAFLDSGRKGAKGGGGHNILKQHSLVVITDKDLNPMILASVARRENDLLAGEALKNSAHSGADGSGGERKNRSGVGLSFFSNEDLKKVLMLSKHDPWGCLVPLNVSVFSYEAVLKRMQAIPDVPLRDLLVDWKAHSKGKDGTENDLPLPSYEKKAADAIERVAAIFSPSKTDIERRSPLKLSGQRLGVNLPAGLEFDISQRLAMSKALRQRVSLVQGPPGTGKTFLGVLLAKIILSHTKEKILCVCFTNHALDSFLEDLLSKGVQDIVRIGSGCRNQKLEPCQLRNLSSTGFNQVQNRQYARLKSSQDNLREEINKAEEHLNGKLNNAQVTQWLQIEDPDAFDELSLPIAVKHHDETIVGKKGKRLTDSDVVDMWLHGDAKPPILRAGSNWEGIFSSPQEPHDAQQADEETGLWSFDRDTRRKMWDTWVKEIRNERVESLARHIEHYNTDARELTELQLQRDIERVKQARVVGCTTTGAAIHQALLQEAACGVVLVEEAAEVLEAHVLTALGPATRHAIMIGDHKQLRPKVEQYELRVESGRGFDLNVSLFERLVKESYPFCTLELQHRMPPEVSALVRGLTYPELRNGPKTFNRPGILGLRDRVCFVPHDRKEATASIMQRQDEGSTGSKSNKFEVEMVVKTTRHLLLQGYKPDQLVVLTPYLAQLRELCNALDGVISEKDAAELAGAMREDKKDDPDDGHVMGSGEESAIKGKQKAKHAGGKTPTSKAHGTSNMLPRDAGRGGSNMSDPQAKIRVATVDNYQGEESDVVIGSFVRSNDRGEMGFVGDPNRLNVAISRARHGMILFGNIDFFTSEDVKNKRGKQLWLEFKSLLEARGHIYRKGLPVKCERHQTSFDLSDAASFDRHVPDGGCQLECGAKLSCTHTCTRRCHPKNDADHKMFECRVLIDEMCGKGHKWKRICRDPPSSCLQCEKVRCKAAFEAKRQAEARRRREEEVEKAGERLAEARRRAAREHEELRHGTELLRLEKDTQRAELDAEEAQASAKRTRATMSKIQGGTAGSAAEGGIADGDEENSGTRMVNKRKENIDLMAKTREDELNNRFNIQAPNSVPVGTIPRAPNNNTQIPVAARTDNSSGVKSATQNATASSGLQASTLRLIAQSAAEGSAQGVLAALETVPRVDRERVSHDLCLALGAHADDWFLPIYGDEPIPSPSPTGRTAQALSMMSSQEFVKARKILASVVEEECGKSSDTTGSRDPMAEYALALCDLHVTGGSMAVEALGQLAAAEHEMWPGVPNGSPPPTSRAFPFGALVRACLESEHASRAEVSAPTDESSPENSSVKASDDLSKDPGALACVWAVAFLRAPDNARKTARIDGGIWTALAEKVVKKHGKALATALWGPEGGVLMKTNDDDKHKMTTAEKIELEWKKIQSQSGICSDAMDELLAMSGLDAIKARFINIVRSAVLDKERGYDLSARSYNVRLEGNPGTGKTTVARLYYRLLKDVGVFANAEQKARELKAAKEAEEKKKADAAKKAQEDAIRQACRSVGLTYDPRKAPPKNPVQAPAPAPIPAPSPALQATAAKGMQLQGFVETTGADLADNGVGGLKDMLEKIRTAGGGVLFVDEAYTLDPHTGGEGKKVLNFLLAEIENRRGELVVAFAGYAKDMEKLFEFNEGLPSRFPETLYFPDYSDELLLQIFNGLIAKKKGLQTLHLAPGRGRGEWWAEVAITRLGRRRGSRGFGNARAVRVLFDRVLQRQSDRLCNEDSGDEDDSSDTGGSAYRRDPFVLTKPDLLGTTVARLDDSASWRELEGMIGLRSVKEAISALSEVVKTNIELEEAGKQPRTIALNRCMLGNPGTGKTTVAKLFAGILTDLGLLSKGEVVLKTASDFIGSVLGESEKKTRAILKTAEGCVLVIDEAYSLDVGGQIGEGGGGSGRDPYRAAVVDTLVEQVQNVPGEDRCVLLLGYQAEMETFMRNSNPGLARRFALDNAFVFEDYSDEELLSILRAKIEKEQLTAGVDALMAAAAVLQKKRAIASHFGNGGEVANLLSEAKLRKERRRVSGSRAARLDPELLPQDFDPEFDEELPDVAALEEELFGDLIGCEDIKKQLIRIRSTFLHAQRLGRDPLEAINMNFRFTGAPGTGKTTVAQRVGRMFKQLGAIASDEVLSCSPVADFQTGYIGQAGRKTKATMDKAIGKVLFIDEAYGLNPNHGNNHSFMREAVDQLVQGLTEDKYKGKMICVLAGYPQEIDDLMDANPGLASRFPETLHFPNFGVDDCCHLLKAGLKRKFSTEITSEAMVMLPRLLTPLVQAPRFGNGRTMVDLAKRIFTEISLRIGDNDGGRGIDESCASIDDICRAADSVIQQMTRVTSSKSSKPTLIDNTPDMAFSSSSSTPHSTGTATKTSSHVSSIEDVPDEDKKEESSEDEETDEHGDTHAVQNSTDEFLSPTEISMVIAACNSAGIPPDSIDTTTNAKNMSELRHALVNSKMTGGLGMPPQEAESLLVRINIDRAALSRLMKKTIQDEAMNKAVVTEAEVAATEAAKEVANAKDGGDVNLIAMLEALKRAKEEALRRLKEEFEMNKNAERAAQAAIRRLGVCVQGFKWIRNGSGWRCAGGTHFLSDGEVTKEISRGST